MIKELRKKLDTEKVTKEELFEESIKKAKETQKKYNCFVTITDKFKSRASNTLLSGIPYSLKDLYSTSGILTTSSSNILKNYIPVYDSTVYKKLKSAGAVLVGKTVLDELAMGGSGTTGHTGAVKNPHDVTRIAGGSSAGSAASVALGITPFSIGSDTGDSVRKPAAFCGIVGFKPTYGRISRYGMFPFASSLDHVAIFATSVMDCAIVTDVLKGHDKNDMTSLKDDGKAYAETLEKEVKNKKLFYIKEAVSRDAYDEIDANLDIVLNNFDGVLSSVRELGITVDEISIDKALLTAIFPSYMAISCAEATSNNANLNGISFGVREEGNTIEEIMFNSRTKGFSELIKRRFVLGSYILQKENQEKLFLNACRIRRLIVNEINKLFEEYDGFIMPASGGVAPKIGEKTDQLSDKYLILENHLVIGNFGGFPSITVPSGKIERMPIGINITGRVKEDDVVLNIAHQLEKKLKEMV